MRGKQNGACLWRSRSIWDWLLQFYFPPCKTDFASVTWSYFSIAMIPLWLRCFNRCDRIESREEAPECPLLAGWECWLAWVLPAGTIIGNLFFNHRKHAWVNTTMPWCADKLYITWLTGSVLWCLGCRRKGRWILTAVSHYDGTSGLIVGILNPCVPDMIKGKLLVHTCSFLVFHGLDR